MESIATRTVLGQEVAVADYQKVSDWVFQRSARRDRAYAVEAANTHVLALARHEKDSFGRQLARFDLICPDGMPLVWTLNAQLGKDERLSDRVYGPTLMLKVMADSEGSGQSHFLLGGREETLNALEEKFARDYPRAEIAGSYSPPFGEWPEDEFERICERIRDSGAGLIWVGLGCPKQEKWIADHLEKLPPGVYFGIGAAFAFHAGEVSQAPSLLQKNGLEWLYRLAMEPKRLWKRYFVYNSLFLFYSLRNRMSAE
ncbi:WecB/TagA/CpsF family glycosyltransferase [Roseibacillus ishigakijimensis]|uniref:WecB/TagA/CpsF family glycosyltransferase n=1 Tax=Roseibacillus ishigakijimensis TaxID=454146 RepID=A0A934RRX3_9BACT|nr:WecB/TagA/CpsF family glycosyltransferase [Roseibacillus ishigakijimensis]MBK1833406.1 WecB/TagA/CpsF family glycosyltransferase [Roseibacillus ishigakijimensis]